MAHSGTSSIEVDATAEEIFEVAADVASYPDWVGDVKEVEVLGTDDDGYPTASRMRVDVSVREVVYELDYTYEYPHSIAWKSRPGGDVKLVEGSYTFEINDAGGTTVVYELALDPGFWVPGFMMERAARHITAQALDGLKARVEEG